MSTEGLLWAVGWAASILAGCALMAAALIFVKADVPRAVRFLRHRPAWSAPARLAPKGMIAASDAAAGPDRAHGLPQPGTGQEMQLVHADQDGEGPTCFLASDGASEREETSCLI